MIRDEKHECMERGDLQKLQGERLAALVARLYENVPFVSAFADRSFRIDLLRKQKLERGREA